MKPHRAAAIGCVFAASVVFVAGVGVARAHPAPLIAVVDSISARAGPIYTNEDGGAGQVSQSTQDFVAPSRFKSARPRSRHPHMPAGGPQGVLETKALRASSGFLHLIPMMVPPPPPPPPDTRQEPPQIILFTGPNRVAPEEPVAVLSWITQNASSASIDNGIGAVITPIGFRPVRLERTTTYTLTAMGPGGRVTRQHTVTVGPSEVSWARDDAYTQQSGASVALAVLDNDQNGYQILDVTAPSAGGSARVGADARRIDYTAGRPGTETFRYTGIDANRRRATALVTVTVTPPSPPFSARDDAYAQRSGARAALAVMDNDQNAARIVGVTPPSAGGAASISADARRIDYTAGRAGAETFTYTVADVSGRRATGVVTVTVTSPPQHVSARNDAYTQQSGDSAVLPVLDNDVNATRIVSVTAPNGGGSASVSADRRRVDYLAGRPGTEAFSYTVVGDSGWTATAAVAVRVTPPPLRVSAGNDVYAQQTRDTAALAVMENDQNAVRIVSVTAPDADGSARISADAQHIEYRAGRVGTETFTYTVADASGQTATGAVTVRVSALPPPPLSAHNDAYTQQSGASVALAVLENDQNAVRIVSVTQPDAGGSASVGADARRIEYRAGRPGTETFRYTIADQTGQAATATVTVGVTTQRQDWTWWILALALLVAGVFIWSPWTRGDGTANSEPASPSGRLTSRVVSEAGESIAISGATGEETELGYMIHWDAAPTIAIFPDDGETAGEDGSEPA